MLTADHKFAMKETNHSMEEGISLQSEKVLMWDKDVALTPNWVLSPHMVMFLLLEKKQC